MIQWKAVWYMMLSAMAFAVMDSILKQVNYFGGFQLVFFRSIASLIIGTSYLLHKKIPILGNERKLLILRGLTGVTSMTLFFSAIAYMPLGSAVSLRYLSPIWATIFAVFVLKEKVFKAQWFFFLIAFLGVIMLKGFDLRISNLGFFMIMGSAFFSGWIFIFIRMIGTRDHPVVIVNYFMAICFIVGGLFSIFNWTTPVGMEWILLLSLGVMGYLGQIFMTKAIQLEEANRIAPLKYLEVVFVLLIGYSFFGEGYGFLSLFAMGIILVSLLMNVVYKKRNVAA